MAASFICNWLSGLYGYGLGCLDVDWGEPVVTVGLDAVDDAEELIVQGRGDGPHGAVADQDAVDGAKVRDFGGRAGEESFVGDVEHLAG